MSKLTFLKLTGKKVMIFLSLLTILFLFLTVTAVLVDKNPNAVLLKQGEQTKPEPGKVIINQGNKPPLNEDKTQIDQTKQTQDPSNKSQKICGNDLCEPDKGETKENCSKDCSAGD